MTDIYSETLMYPRNYQPFGRPWKKWAAIWCKWLLSIPMDRNPAFDKTGKNFCQEQSNANVWFLAGTFGNNVPVRRKCTLPKSKAILFPIVNKEDSFAEDSDIFYGEGNKKQKEQRLAKRAREAMDRLICLQLIVDGKRLPNLGQYRILSDFFDLTFPKDNVYNVGIGTTRAVCDGYWAFLRPLPVGSHEIYFSAQIFLPKDDEVTIQMKNTPIFDSIAEYIDKYSRLNIEVTYELTVK